MSREASTAKPIPAAAAQVQCQPQPSRFDPDDDKAQVTMPAIMKRAGIVKFRKFNMPMVRVKATATKAKMPPNIRPLMICCMSCTLSLTYK